MVLRYHYINRLRVDNIYASTCRRRFNINLTLSRMRIDQYYEVYTLLSEHAAQYGLPAIL